MTVYSFKDLSGSFFHPAVGSFILNGGNIGFGQVTVAMTTEKTAHDVAADGSIMVSFISGDNGSVDIEVQQTSQLHNFLLSWYNAIKTAADAGDVTLWAAGSMLLRNIVDRTSHTLTGISPSKIPDKVYAAQGGKVTWKLMAADAQQINA
jgi:Bacteriophage KPP10, Structural protein ORF10